MRKPVQRFLSGFNEGFSNEFRRLSKVAVGLEMEDPAGTLELEEEEVADQLILEVIERVHERFLDRLNALDTALVGLMAAILAIAAIAIDKYTDFSASLPYFVASLVCSGGGWFVGNAVWPVPEPVDPAHFIAGVRQKGADALPLRLAKVIAVAVGIGLLIVGVASAIRAKDAIVIV